MIKKYRKKPVIIEAVQWTGDNQQEIYDFTNGAASYEKCKDCESIPAYYNLSIETLEGKMRAIPLDFIIKGVQGEFYPCKPDIFEATYKEVIDG